MERVTWKLTIPYVNYIANGNLLYGSGNSNRALHKPRGMGLLGHMVVYSQFFKESPYGERGGEGEMHGESNMETYITICRIDSQREFAVWLRKPKQRLGINLEGWHGEEDGREVQKGGDTCIPMADSCRGLTENNKIL